MNPMQPPPTTPRRENLIQGPRPAPLRVSKDSFKIKKPPKHPHPQPSHAPVPPPANQQPVIIYSVSPKPYIVEASNFRSLVQHLTGRSSTSPAPATDTAMETTFDAGETPPSPAARLAVMERTSPKERDRWRGDGSGTVEVEEDVDVMRQMPAGILSPAPANLPVMSPGMFSPAPGFGDGFMGMGELMSPFMMSNMSFIQSPSALFFSNAPIVSPSPSGEYFNIFDL